MISAKFKFKFFVTGVSKYFEMSCDYYELTATLQEKETSDLNFGTGICFFGI